jgi:hypothetical protein
MVDGTLVPLFAKPAHYGAQFFDRKSNYLVGVQVSLLNMFALNARAADLQTS